MEPASSLLLPKLNPTHPQHVNRGSPKKHVDTPSVEEPAAQFPSTGNPADIFLNFAFNGNFIDAKGRIKDASFNILKELDEEIRAVINTLNITHENSGIQPKKDSKLPFLPLDLLPCIFELRKQWGGEALPEIIGGAVGHLLGAQFYISYMEKRFGFNKEEAIKILTPLLEQIGKTPADIDCRQYVDWEINASFLDTKQLFKPKLSAMICEIVKKANPKNKEIQDIDIKTMIHSYYQKLFLLTEPIRYGIGRFGKFLAGGAPLEYLIVPDKLKRPFITFHKSVAIVITPPDKGHGKPTTTLKFYTDSCKSPSIHPETVFFQQIAMIHDTHDFVGQDSGGFFSVMAEDTRVGTRALTPEFYNNLWDIVTSQNHDLMTSIEWAAKNHLVGRGESEEIEHELLVSFHLNILLYLIDRNQISDEVAKVLLKKHIKSVDSLSLLHDCLQTPMLPLQTKLAWFRLGMWIKMGLEIPEDSLSTNYGTLCHRIVCPHSKSIVWIPVDLKRSCQLVLESLRNEAWKFQNEKLIFLLMHFVKPSDTFNESPAYALADFNKWMNSSSCKNVADALREKSHPHALALSFGIDFARIQARNETGLPAGMMKIIPEVLSVYPEYYEIVKSLLLTQTALRTKQSVIVSVPSLEKMTSTLEWISYFVTSKERHQRAIGIGIFKDLPVEDRCSLASQLLPRLKGRVEEQVVIFHQLDEMTLVKMKKSLEQFILSLFGKKLGIKIDPECYPWLLMMLALGAGNRHCQLKVTDDKKKELVFVYEGRQKYLPIVDTDIVKAGIAIFENPSKQQYCLDIFNELFPQLQFENKPLLEASTDFDQLLTLSNRLMSHPIGSQTYLQGLKIYFMVMQNSRNAVAMAVELLKYYPELHIKIPSAGKTIIETLSPHPDAGSQLLNDLFVQEGQIDQFDWIAALLSHQRKGCQMHGIHLVGTLSEKDQYTAWERTFFKLIAFRWDFIAKARARFSQIKITPKTYPLFFLTWIKKLKELNQVSYYHSFMEVIRNCSDFKLENPHPGKDESYFDWITHVEQLIANPHKAIPAPRKVKTPAAPKVNSPILKAKTPAPKVEVTAPKVVILQRPKVDIPQEQKIVVTKSISETPPEPVVEIPAPTVVTLVPKVETPQEPVVEMPPPIVLAPVPKVEVAEPQIFIPEEPKVESPPERKVDAPAPKPAAAKPKGKPKGKSTAPKGSKKPQSVHSTSNQKAITSSTFLAHLTGQLHSFNKAHAAKEPNLVASFKKIQNEIETLTELYANDLSLDEFCKFYEFYYTQLAFIELKTKSREDLKKPTAVPKGAMILLQLLTTIQFPKKKFLRNYLDDLTLIFESLFVSDPKKIPFSIKQVSTYFELYLERYAFGFKEKTNFPVAFKRLTAHSPHPKCLDKPILTYPPLLLSMNLAPTERLITPEDLVAFAEYVQKRLKSDNLIEVDTGYLWLSEICQDLIGKLRLKECNEFLASVFLTNGLPTPLTYPSAAWMVSRGYSYWIVRVLEVIQIIDNSEIQKIVRAQLLDYFSRYESLVNVKPRDKISSYMDFISILVLSKKQEVTFSVPLLTMSRYDSITTDFLDKVLQDFFPNRHGTGDPEIVRKFANTCFFAINLKCCGIFENVVDFYSQYRDIAQYHIDFCKKIANLAVQSNDRAALTIFFEEYKSCKTMLKKQDKPHYPEGQKIFDSIDEDFLKSIAIILQKSLESIDSKNVVPPQKQSARSDMLRAASKMAQENDIAKFYKYFMELEPLPEDLPLYTKLLTPKFRTLKLSLLQQVNLYLKYRYYDVDVWSNITGVIATGDQDKNKDVLDVIGTLYSPKNEYGKSLWDSKDSQSKSLWASIVMNIVIQFFDVNHEKIIEIAEKIHPYIPESKPLDKDENRLRCTTIFIINVLSVKKRLSYYDYSLDPLIQELALLVGSVSTFSNDELGAAAPKIMLYYWLCSSILTQYDATKLLEEILKNDVNGDKRYFVARILNLVSENMLEKRVDVVFDGLNLIAHDPALKAINLHSIMLLFKRNSHYVLRGQIVENNPFVKAFSELVPKLQLDQFLNEDSQIQTNCKRIIYEQFINELENPTKGFLTLFIPCIPTNSWLQYLHHILKALPAPDQRPPSTYLIQPNKGIGLLSDPSDKLSEPVRRAIGIIFKQFSTKFSKEEITRFFQEFYTNFKIHFALSPQDLNSKSTFNERHKCLLMTLDTINLNNDKQKMLYVKDIYSALLLLLDCKPKSCSITVEEATQYFKLFMVMITQKFRRGIDAWYLLKLLTDRHHHSPMISFPLKTLRSVNLSIGTPIKEYTSTVPQQTEVAATIFRYLFSGDPMVVNTGLTWLSIVIFELKSPEELQHILALIFDEKYRKEFMTIRADLASVSFTCKNNGPLIIEPWMMLEGLNLFFLKLIDAFSKITLEPLNTQLLNFFGRYIGINVLALDLSFEDQLTCNERFCVIITRAKANKLFETKTFNPPLTYESLVTNFLNSTLLKYYPKRKKIGVMETCSALVAFSIKLFDEMISSSPRSKEEHNQEIEKCKGFYSRYYQSMLDLAEKNKDVEFVKHLLGCFMELKKDQKHPIYKEVVGMLNEWLQKVQP